MLLESIPALRQPGRYDALAKASCLQKDLRRLPEMSQGDVIAWLKRHPGWHQTSAVVLGMSQGYKGVQRSLSKATTCGDIESRKDGFRKEWRAPSDE
jgi:hypothetical protein